MKKACKLTIACLLLLCLSKYSFGQVAKTIVGIVKDSVSGTAIPGVSIQEEGTTKGAITTAEGTFRLELTATAKNIIATSVGYERKSIAVSGDSLIILLTPSIDSSLNDVVVIGYGTIKKENLTSAVTEVKAKDFNSGGARNAMDLIQGKVAGLSITRNSGTNPNSSPSIQLRGVASLNGGNSPLVVIDGVPGGNLDLLQQSDIESMTVLKDGSAAAIYGTRANGGVILVTTKKGKSGEAQYNYSGWVRKESLYRYPKVMSAADYRQKIQSGDYSRLSKDNDRGSSTDWFDELINHGNISHYQNVSMSGGNDKTNYRASMYYSNYQGIAKENSRQQYGATASIYNKGFNNKLTTELNAMINYNNANLLGGGNWEDALFNLNPTQSPYDTANRQAGGYWYEKEFTNVVSRLHQEKDQRNQQTSLITLKSTLNVIKDLNVSVSGSIQRDQWEENTYRMLASHASLADGDYPGGGYAKKENSLTSDYVFEPTVEYNSSFSPDHTINAVAGYSYQYHTSTDFWAENKGFISDEEAENNLEAGNALKTGKANLYSDKYANKLIAFFGRVNYAYKNKYLAQFILRHEGSTRFGSNNKWGNFPAASVGWTISQEEFMKGISWINNLKLRAGYGITGNQDFDNGISTVTLGTGGFYILPDGTTWTQTYGPDKNPNPDLRWERKKEFNLGFDFALFDHRLSGSIDYFNRKTSGLAVPATVQQPSNVVGSTWLNIGELSNKGFELALGADPIRQKDFVWHIDATGSHATSRLLKYTNGNYLDGANIGNPGNLGNSERIVEGGKIGQFYGKRFAGFDADGKWLFYNAAGEKVSASDISPNTDYAYIGNGLPKYYASLTNTFTYKNYSLRLFFRGKFGYKILNTMDMAYGNLINLPNNVLTSAFTRYKDIDDTYQYSDYYLQNGNYIKLDEVTFSYQIPIPKNKYVRSVNAYITGSNLWLITKYKGNDPDFVNDTGLFPGFDGPDDASSKITFDGRVAYPSTRSFVLGVNIGF